MRFGRKGISELVAALIMVMIVMAGAIIVYVYSSGMLGSLQGAQPQQGQYTNQIALEYYDWTNLQRLNLILRNVGSGRGTIAAFYISSTTSYVAININNTSTCKTTTALLPQTTCNATLFIPISFSISQGISYTVKVATRDGAVFSYTCIAGQTSSSP